MIVFLARDIQAFVMYCVNGTSGSSLLIESTDSMIHVIYILELYGYFTLTHLHNKVHTLCIELTIIVIGSGTLLLCLLLV